MNFKKSILTITLTPYLEIRGLLYGTGSYTVFWATGYFVIMYKVKESEKEYTYIYVCVYNWITVPYT